MKSLLLFDIDGTLLLSGGCGRVAFENAFSDLFKIPNAWGNTLPDGKTDFLIIDEIANRELSRSLREEEYNSLCKLYSHHFNSEIGNSPRFRLMPGVINLLERLAKDENILLALATGNLENVSWLKLKRGKMDHYFKCGGFGSDATHRIDILQKAVERARHFKKHHFEKNEIYVIGDTSHDIKAANELGFKSIGVMTGNTEGKEFKHTPPTYLLKDFKNTEAFMKILKSSKT